VPFTPFPQYTDSSDEGEIEEPKTSILSFSSISFFIKELTENHCHSYRHGREYIERSRAYYKAISDVLSAPFPKKLFLYYFFRGLPSEYIGEINELIKQLDKQTEGQVDIEDYLIAVDFYTYSLYLAYKEQEEKDINQSEDPAEEHEFLCKG
jgi:hypothetical protein